MTEPPAIVIGAGVGGLACAIALARSGQRVRLLEARDVTGGLAGRHMAGGKAFDNGPYVLLDRPGLEWAFERFGERLEDHLELLPIDEVYRVHWPDGQQLSVYRDLDRTANGFEARWPGSGAAYRDYIARMTAVYEALRPLQTAPFAGVWGILGGGRWRHLPFLLRPLRVHLEAAGLPQRVVDLLAIWTHIAGQSLEEAPAPLALVPAIIHRHGAWAVRGGLHQVPAVLTRLAEAAGVEIECGQPVRRIQREGRRVTGVVTDTGVQPASAVYCNAGGIACYVDLLDAPPPDLVAELRALPLQSPGCCAYLEVDAKPDTPFLQFLLPEQGFCRCLVYPGAVDPERAGQARFLSPVAHAWSQQHDVDQQRLFLSKLLAETWWRGQVTKFAVLSSRVPAEWGADFRLFRDSMNPTMTAQFMRRGRLPHRSPVCDNLYVVGSATHPGQWVSFCAISGILAVDQATC